MLGEFDKGTQVRHSRGMSKPALGRGLGALLGGVTSAPKPTLAAPQNPASPAPPLEAGPDTIRRVPLERVRPCPLQPRKEFTEESLRELADSIHEQGIVQPLVVRAQGDVFELIAGERRWRAAQICGLKEVPILVRQADDAAVLELALIENLQRENLNPLEEANGYQQLIDQFNLRQEDVAIKVGKSRVAVANALRLLKLPPELQGYVRNNLLSVGHAKVILGLATPDQQRLAAERIIKDGLNVRQTEDLISRLQAGQAPVPQTAVTNRAPASKDIHVAALEGQLQERLGTKVLLQYRKGKGSVEIRFYSDQDLDRILQLLGINPE